MISNLFLLSWSSNWTLFQNWARQLCHYDLPTSWRNKPVDGDWVAEMVFLLITRKRLYAPLTNPYNTIHGEDLQQATSAPYLAVELTSTTLPTVSRRCMMAGWILQDFSSSAPSASAADLETRLNLDILQELRCTAARATLIHKISRARSWSSPEMESSYQRLECSEETSSTVPVHPDFTRYWPLQQVLPPLCLPPVEWISRIGCLNQNTPPPILEILQSGVLDKWVHWIPGHHCISWLV